MRTKSVVRTSNCDLDPNKHIELNNYMRDITGYRSGKLVALHPNSKNKNGRVFWTCICDCGNKKVVLSGNITGEKSRSCGCAWRQNCGNKNARWSGYKGMSGTCWNKIKHGAAKRNIDFNITKKYIWDLYIEQNKRCALTGIEITLTEHDAHRTEYTASLDRIDSSKPYEENNVQWVHKEVNIMKGALDQKRFVELCQLVVKMHCTQIDFSLLKALESEDNTTVAQELACVSGVCEI